MDDVAAVLDRLVSSLEGPGVDGEIETSHVVQQHARTPQAPQARSRTHGHAHGHAHSLPPSATHAHTSTLALTTSPNPFLGLTPSATPSGVSLTPAVQKPRMYVTVGTPLVGVPAQPFVSVRTNTHTHTHGQSSSSSVKDAASGGTPSTASSQAPDEPALFFRWMSLAHVMSHAPSEIPICVYSRCAGGKHKTPGPLASSGQRHGPVKTPGHRSTVSCAACEHEGAARIARWCCGDCMRKGWAEHAAAAHAHLMPHDRDVGNGRKLGATDKDQVMFAWLHSAAKPEELRISPELDARGVANDELVLKRLPPDTSWACIAETRVFVPPPAVVGERLRLCVYVCAPADAPVDLGVAHVEDDDWSPPAGMRLIGAQCVVTDPVMYPACALPPRSWAVRLPPAGVPAAWKALGLTSSSMTIRAGTVTPRWEPASAHALCVPRNIARTAADVLASGFPRPALKVAAHAALTSSALRAAECIRVVSFNLLAEIYALGGQYPGAPVWALSWPYRARAILQVLAQADADVLCLQEVQSEHFEATLAPMLAKAGYTALYKQKTREALGLDGKIDGCAMFFRHSRLQLVDNFVVEFNQAAEDVTTKRLAKLQSATMAGLLTAEQAATHAKKLEAAARRLMKDNVAQCAVFRIAATSGNAADTSPTAANAPSVCVVNTHLTWDPAFEDVKLWQTHCLLSAVSELRSRHAATQLHADSRTGLPAPMPVIIAGDFNAEPGTSVHRLLNGTLDSSGLPPDPCEVLPERVTVPTPLHLASAYAAVTGGEPVYTNYTKSYRGTLDYVWFTRDSACALTALLVPHPRDLARNPQLPAIDQTAMPRDLDEGGVPLRFRTCTAYDAHTELHDEDGSLVQLPNRYYPSDHVFLVFDIALQPDPAYTPE